MKETESWHVIEEFPNYSVSSWGNVRNDVTERIRKLGTNIKGYFNIGFPDPLTDRKKKEKYFMVHRLVGTYFVANPLSKKEINHIDGNKKNNHYKNLEWVTPSENVRHKIDVLGKGVAETNSRALLSNWEVLIICDMIKTKSFSEVDILIGLPGKDISRNIAHGTHYSSITSHISHIPYYKTNRFKLLEFDVLIICEMYKRNIPRKKICELMNIKLCTLNAVLNGVNHMNTTSKVDYLPYQNR